MTNNLWRAAAGFTASLVVGATALVLSAPAAFALPPTTSAIPVPGLVANCPPASNSVGSGITTINGIAFTGMSGECTLTQAHAAVGSSKFGNNTILSATSRCTVNGTPTSSAFYNGMTITGAQTIVTPDGYTLNFNVPVTTGTQAGRIAVQIISPGGTVTNVAETLCMGAAYPLNANLNTSPAQALSPVPSSSHSGPSSALLLLGGALVAFVVVNVTGVRRYRRRHGGGTTA